jgi:hypothetical protein
MFVANKSHEFQVMVQYVDDILYFLIVHVVESCILLTIIIHKKPKEIHIFLILSPLSC